MSGYALEVAIISGAFGILGTLLSIRSEIRSRQAATAIEDFRLAEARRYEKQQIVAKYREPLARAAYDLQSRLYNILSQGLVTVYLTNGNERERTYVVENTVFLLAQYFGWTEIIRRDIQYLDLGEDEQTRRLAHLQDVIYSLFLTDRWGPLFRVFAGEQRAIGERMIQEKPRGSECLGYGTFLAADFVQTDPLLTCLRQDVLALEHGLAQATSRLIAVQGALIDLLGFLDPDFVRFPNSRRTKL